MVTHSFTAWNCVRLALNSCFIRGKCTNITIREATVRQLPKHELNHVHVSEHLSHYDTSVMC